MIKGMKARVEKLWAALQDARTDAEKDRLRNEYREALEAYQRQKMLEETGGHEDGHVRAARAAPPQQRKPAEFSAPESERPDPFSFTDYRDYLIAWIRCLKASKGVTLKEFAEKAKIDTPALVRVLKQWKPMTLDEFRRILDLLEMTTNERNFLEALHCMSDTRSTNLRLEALRRMLSFSEFRKKHPRDYEAWRYISHWYYVAILEMTTQEGFKAEADWIRARLRKNVPLAEIRKALNFLEGAGFIKIHLDGRVEKLVKEINCTGGIYRLALGSYHRQMLELVSHAIEEVPPEKRFVLSRTLTISRSKFEAVRAILEETIERISKIEDGGAVTDDVHHVEIALIPLTKGSEVED